MTLEEALSGPALTRRVTKLYALSWLCSVPTLDGWAAWSEIRGDV